MWDSHSHPENNPQPLGGARDVLLKEVVNPGPAAGVFRQIAESLLLLAVAVVLFRGFFAEGYLISTGSMAPSLLGYHRQVTCPSCHYQFARGAAFDSDSESGEIAWADSTSQHVSLATCPNCGLHDINAGQSPRNEGDQLLVHKHAYEFRDPRRWEVIVFRNPRDQRQAYVKRVAGLPNETVEIIDGDVYADGTLQRKPLEVQRALRVPVANYDYQPEDGDPDWQPNWVTESLLWELKPGELRFAGRDVKRTEWVEYWPWIRQGGNHLTRVDLEEWPAGVTQPNPRYSNLRYENGELICEGALTSLEFRRWQHRSDDKTFQKVLHELFVLSHCGPIADTYGYNRAVDKEDVHPVYDFMACVELKDVVGSGRFEIDLTDGTNDYRAVLDFHDRTVEVLRDEHAVPIREGKFTIGAADNLLIEFSIFDRTVCLAINGEEVISPFEDEQIAERQAVYRPFKIGAAGITCAVERLELYRDIYYTQKSESGEQIFRTESDEFFVLGDNSPVSVDSRVWEDPAVPRSNLIGKPLIVHLPSRQGQINWGGQVRHVRIPDFSRVRYIR